MASEGVVATSGRVFRMAQKSPTKAGAVHGFMSNSGAQSNTPADDNGLTLLGNLSNPYHTINGVSYRINTFTNSLVSSIFTINDPNGDLVETDIATISTHLGTIDRAAHNSSFQNSAGVASWFFQFVFGSSTNPPIIIDTTNTSSTSSFTYLDIT